MIRRRQMLIAAGALAGLAGLAMAAPSCGVLAQGTCTDSCRAAYGSCYKSTQNRAHCQAQLQRCLEACIHSKR